MSICNSTKKKILVLFFVFLTSFTLLGESVYATSDTSKLSVPGGKLYAKVWRTTGDGKSSGNSKKWNYQVSSSYSGKKKVKFIRCTWRSSATLRCSASISIGISDSGGSASASSSWQTVKSKEKYWQNSNGSKESSWRSNITVGPKKYYDRNTIYSYSKGRVKIKGYPKYYEITASI